MMYEFSALNAKPGCQQLNLKGCIRLALRLSRNIRREGAATRGVEAAGLDPVLSRDVLFPE